MAKSKEYWAKRFEQLEAAQSNKGAAYFAELEKQYNKASKSVQDEIDKWFARFAENNEISLQEARKLLTSEELEEFKWSVMEYIEKGETLKYSDEWAKALENASSKFHISRLEALKIQMQNHVEVLYGNELDEIAKLMEEIYTDGYYHTAYEIQKGFNIGYSMMKLDKNQVEKVLSKPWAADGSNFSDRIWKQKNQLVSELHNNLTQAIIRGKNPNEITDEIAKRFNVSKGQAGRLVMTESAFFASASNRDGYKDLDVEQYEILATLDKKTSDVCRDMDGKVFKLSEYAIGITAPPFHCWCRTTTVPYFNDEFELELESQRAARNENDKTYYVPSSMKYEDWYEENVWVKEEKKKKKASSSDKEQFERYRNVLGDMIPEDIEKFKDIKYNNIDEWNTLKHNYRVVNSYELNSGNMTPEKIIELDEKAFTTKRDFFTGTAKRKGNAAAVEIDGEIMIANSQLTTKNNTAYVNYKGNKDELILREHEPQFITKVIGSHDRNTDAEAKIFEYLDKKFKDDDKHHTINLLSEKTMCESCLGVMEQFKEKHPNVDVNVVSNKKERNDKNKGKPWKHRK